MRKAGFVASYFDAWNQRDAVAIADHLTPSGTYCDIHLNQQLTRAALITNLTNLFAHEYYRYELVGEALSSETTIAYQYRATPMDHQGRDAAESPWYGAEFMTVNSEAAIRIADYYEITSESADPARVNASEQLRSKYARSGLGEQQMKKYKGQLHALMDQDKMYLRSDLTLPKLAVLVNCSVNHLSQVLNAGFGMSFFDFINSYRIEAAGRILSGEEGGSSAILDIPFAVGFNTNSAFYSAFKKFTGQTPAQYRRLQLKIVQSG